ncbi:hypothetical protein CVT26_006150 [Gymnopilus dilepis]|uniref:Uncharacterized protein n=1 Tax=Gymnopilus dilepis TaxID=231916 RepID=A0A409WG70_9AGAR|nr:hypothetical protein CVT26_006150 [Gymnopilus dilepis]
MSTTPRRISILKKGETLSVDVDEKLNSPWEERPYPINPPAEVITDRKHYYYLGWPSNEDQLHELCRPEHPIMTRGRHATAAYVLRSLSGYPFIHVVGAEPRTSEQNILAEEYGGIDFVAIWMSHPAHFSHYPTNGQVEKLIEIFGSEPVWYRDYYTKRNFFRHGIRHA